MIQDSDLPWLILIQDEGDTDKEKEKGRPSLHFLITVQNRAFKEIMACTLCITRFLIGIIRAC